MNKEHGDLIARQGRKALKRTIALKLRILRDSANMTNMDVSKESGILPDRVSRMESLGGPIPGLDSIKRYVEACGGHCELIITFAKPPAASRQQ